MFSDVKTCSWRHFRKKPSLCMSRHRFLCLSKSCRRFYLGWSPMKPPSSLRTSMVRWMPVCILWPPLTSASRLQEKFSIAARSSTQAPANHQDTLAGSFPVESYIHELLVKVLGGTGNTDDNDDSGSQHQQNMRNRIRPDGKCRT